MLEAALLLWLVAVGVVVLLSQFLLQVPFVLWRVDAFHHDLSFDCMIVGFKVVCVDLQNFLLQVQRLVRIPSLFSETMKCSSRSGPAHFSVSCSSFIFPGRWSSRTQICSQPCCSKLGRAIPSCSRSFRRWHAIHHIGWTVVVGGFLFWQIWEF